MGGKMKEIEQVSKACNGMLPQAVYQKIFEIGRRGGVIVEVGTALGAATVALALGLKASGVPGKIYSFDPMLGGPRRQLSNVADRVAHVRHSLKLFEVDHLVELVTASLPDGIAVIPTDSRISVLMLDADGCIDRELELLYDRLAPNADLIIDDVRDTVRIRPSGWGTYKIDAKQRLSFLLVRALRDSGAISQRAQIKDTYFGHKVAGRTMISQASILEAYRGVIFTETRHGPLSAIRSIGVRRFEHWAPTLLQHARILYRRPVRPVGLGVVQP